MPGNYGYSLKLLPVLHQGWKSVLNSVTQTLVFFFLFLHGNTIMAAISSGDKSVHVLTTSQTVPFRPPPSIFLRTWVKFSSLSGHGGGRILQLVGCCGACAIHAVGGHVSPVSGCRIILGILVLAKRCIWGIILHRITQTVIKPWDTKSRDKTAWKNWEVSLEKFKVTDLDFTSVPSPFSNLLFSRFCILYLPNN